MPSPITLRPMSERTALAPIPAPSRAEGAAGVSALCALLLFEAVCGVAAAIYLSLLAGGYRESLSGASGLAAEEGARFAAGGAILFAIAAYIAFRGARRRRAWSWTLSAILQLILAIAGGIAMFSAGENGVTAAYLATFVLAAIGMLILSSGGVRRALGQA